MESISSTGRNAISTNGTASAAIAAAVRPAVGLFRSGSLPKRAQASAMAQYAAGAFSPVNESPWAMEPSRVISMARMASQRSAPNPRASRALAVKIAPSKAANSRIASRIRAAVIAPTTGRVSRPLPQPVQEMVEGDADHRVHKPQHERLLNVQRQLLAQERSR